jgi:hypothetical protein
MDRHPAVGLLHKSLINKKGLYQAYSCQQLEGVLVELCIEPEESAHKGLADQGHNHQNKNDLEYSVGIKRD